MNPEINQNIEQLHSSHDEGTLVRRSVAHNMRKVRLARGQSLRDLATETNLSTALLSQIERAVANPTVVALTRIAAALDISFADLTLKAICLLINRESLVTMANNLWSTPMSFLGRSL